MANEYRVAMVVVLVGLVVVGFVPSIAYSGDSGERKVPYTGPKVSSWTLLCTASHMAAAGFWRDLSDTTVSEGARFQKESKPTHWRVSISKESGTAQVVRFNENSEELEAPTTFTAEFTPGGGFLLVKKTRDPGTAPETITIDPLNSSFVYSSQHVNVMWNRTNIWYGACRPYE